LVTASIRPATDDDIGMLHGIETAADAMLIDLFAPDEWVGAMSGEARAATPGFVVVVADEAGGPAVGFAHVVEHDGLAHLEQVAVLPTFGRRGLGRSLVEAAKSEAAARGHSSMTLRTYADVPFNAPFYRTCGFVETDIDSAFNRSLLKAEIDAGLLRYGRRIQMTAPLLAGWVGPG
jgi:GNAT superfamily N-acetyltransferase